MAMIRTTRAAHMTALHRQALDSASHMAHTASLIAGRLDDDRAPEEPSLRCLEEWTALVQGDLGALKAQIKGLRHEQKLRSVGQA